MAQHCQDVQSQVGVDKLEYRLRFIILHLGESTNHGEDYFIYYMIIFVIPCCQPLFGFLNERAFLHIFLQLCDRDVVPVE